MSPNIMWLCNYDGDDQSFKQMHKNKKLDSETDIIISTGVLIIVG